MLIYPVTSGLLFVLIIRESKSFSINWLNIWELIAVDWADIINKGKTESEPPPPRNAEEHTIVFKRHSLFLVN